MAFTFPANPTVGQTYSVSDRRYTWTGVVWSTSALPYTDNSITTNALADSAVTEIKIASNAVVESKISNNAVTSNKIANSAVTSGKIASGAVVSNLGFTPASTGKAIAMSIVFGG